MTTITCKTREIYLSVVEMLRGWSEEGITFEGNEAKLQLSINATPEWILTEGLCLRSSFDSSEVWVNE